MKPGRRTAATQIRSWATARACMSGNPVPVPREGTADAAFRELLARVIGSGVTHASGPASHNAGRPIRELVHGSLEFGQLPQRLAGCAGPGAWISPGLAAARFLYLLTGRRDLKFIAPFSGGVRKFSADGIYLGGSAYGAQLFGDQPGADQIRRCAQVITSRPNTKRAAATLFPPYTGNETSVDVACCLGIVFVPRSGALDASVIMRANDALRLLPYNLFEFSMLAELVARLTGLEPGTYRHLAVSMHLRGDGDRKLRRAGAMQHGRYGQDAGPHMGHRDRTGRPGKRAVGLPERAARTP